MQAPSVAMRPKLAVEIIQVPNNRHNPSDNCQLFDVYPWLNGYRRV